MGYKCPVCKECLDYKLKDIGNKKRYLLHCFKCNKYFILNPGKELVSYDG